MESTLHNRLSSKALKLYETGLHSDFQLVCRDRRWKLHRAIIFESSEAFAAAGDGNDQDGHRGVVVLDDDVPELVDLMVQYFYKHAYSDDDVVVKHDEEGAFVFSTLQHDLMSLMSASTISPDSEDSEDDEVILILQARSAAQLQSSLLVNVCIYGMADGLDIPCLKQLALHKFQERLMEHGEWPYYKFTEVVATVLSEIPKDDSGLRAIVQELLIKNASELLNNDRNDLDGNGFHEGRGEWFKVLSQDVDFVLAIWAKTVTDKM